jgi:hypothetical protein
VVNRGFRSGSAPTPTPLNKQSTNNYYIRRPTVVFNDERNGPSDKSSGAQAKVNQKFVNFDFQKNSFSSKSNPSLSIRYQLFDRIRPLIIDQKLVFILPQMFKH